MKKVILTTMAILAFGFANAQKTRFGVKGGLNVSTLTGEYEDDTKSLIGFHVGGFAEIKVIERLAIQPELLFSAQGARFEGIGNDKYDAKLNYLNIPVLAKFYITKQFTVEAGPQIGFLLSAKIEGEDAKDFYKSADFGFNFGAGYNFTDNFSAGIRYTVGLSGVYDNDNEDLEDYIDSSKNSNLALFVGYKFN
ncbi:opacity protein-like surface antigen [Flavobacterium sp. 2755]|uniref:porin family protein n=1 Tax=Flavobacterium sp. 2755 TaxID=2817765 RepID=UPI0028650110|nr:porin family protein [Flavobacterium sp. 2755]MDR6762770.1 opacity protein-like surface antigen [Flavobacterium sp. 2755]